MDHEHPIVVRGEEYSSPAAAYISLVEDDQSDEEGLPIMAEILSERYKQDPEFAAVIDALKSKNWRLVHQDQSRGVSFWGAHVNAKTKKERGGNMLGRMISALANAKAAK